MLSHDDCEQRARRFRQLAGSAVASPTTGCFNHWPIIESRGHREASSASSERRSEREVWWVNKQTRKQTNKFKFERLSHPAQLPLALLTSVGRPVAWSSSSSKLAHWIASLPMPLLASPSCSALSERRQWIQFNWIQSSGSIRPMEANCEPMKQTGDLSAVDTTGGQATSCGRQSGRPISGWLL